MKILIATMTCGEGHNAIARSLRDGFGEGHEVRIVDIYAHRGEKGGYEDTYLFFVHYFPRSYHLVWEIGRRLRADRRYRGLAMSGVKRGADEMARVLAEFRPDVVICTHNYASNLFCWLKIHNRCEAKIYSVFFDYINCPYWEGSVLCEAVFTPHEIVHPSLIGRGFREEQLLPFGFPVNPKYKSGPGKEEVRKSLGIPEDAFVALTLNGGAGLGNTTGLVKTLMKADTGGKELVVLAVCGRNARAKRDLEALVAKNGWKNVRVYGFVDNVHEMMRASDLYFCRGGGGAVSEAMVSGVNFVVREGVTAQELENKKIFLGRGLCYGMDRVSDAKRILEKAIRDPQGEEEMRSRVRAFVHREGVDGIVGYITEAEKKK